MPLPHCPAKYGSRAIITARQAIEAGRQGAPPDCPPDLILLYQKSLWRELNAAAVRKATGDRAPFVVLDRGDAPVAVAGGFGVGAPAAVVCLEMCVALGARRVVVVGYAGALRPGVDPGDVLLCDRAVRDEGTSYHYLPAGAEARAHPELLDACRRALAASEIDAVTGTCWTTDAPFRETEAEVREMQAAGVLAVEMELAAVYAAAQVRGVAAAGLCVVSDSLSELEWHPHFRDPHVQQRLRAVFDVTTDLLARSSAGALPRARHVGQTP
ncbi:MAG: nucleoside phosphorylase [Spirochaetaceae bacterium]|nr:nucleoside phosphorylase [Spirochaetaceae bacterium]